MKESLVGATRERLTEAAVAAGLPAYAGRQVADWIYRKGATDFDQMTNLSRAGRAALAERWEIGLSSPVKVRESADGTKKYLFACHGGFVEAAWIPEEDRGTLCLSVQVGCKMGCLFCMTGKQGFQAHLGAGEILNQYLSLPERARVTNIVYMGMGEPLDNLANVLDSLEVLTSDYGPGLSPTRVTVSTVGLLPAMRTFLDSTRCHLAVSLHTPFEEERRRLMPIENVHPLAEVLAELRSRRERGQRRVSFEYIVFGGLNDTPRHAKEMGRILNGIRCRVNLIPFHAIPGTPLDPSPRGKMEEFQALLRERGLLTTIRQSRGQDIEAACGLLSTRELVRSRGGSGE
ncbi:MAG TPA: 23S rRNA (adenine(2503)-C(2))-methyltransferase RlmN [Spirochaetia bacterium]|nr:23S rRNA (adenine(2503)-C(2))-methyltransferase RlmN [Spirochaetia bacterium]